ncbi:PD40 domain-containing protein [Candidatus Poribacteria bacterium]|nr:PD40 domain-containing protein [Candidatus Poribacteria bacterium]
MFSEDSGDPAVVQGSRFWRPKEYPRYTQTNPVNEGEYVPDDNYEFPSSPMSPAIDYIIHSNRPTTDTESTDPAYNPSGRYFANYSYIVASNANGFGSIPLSPQVAGSGHPLILEVVIKHELGVENVSTPASDGKVQDPFLEFDSIEVMVNGSVVGTLLGDTSLEPTLPLLPATRSERVEETIGEVNHTALRSVWEQPADSPYIPQKGDSGNFFRTYRFYAGRATGSTASVIIQMNTGPSYLPEYDPDEDGQTFAEVPEIRRDFGGFQISSIRLFAVTGDARDFVLPRSTDGRRIAESGTLPLWSNGENEVYFLDTDLHGVKTAYSDGLVRPRINDINLAPIRRGAFELFRVDESRQVLSMDRSPLTNLIMYVTDGDSTGGRIFLVRDDGFDERRLTTEDDGAIEATFSNDTDTVVFTTGSAIYTERLDGTNKTFVLDSAGTELFNFRSVTLDASDEVLAFTASDADQEVDLYWALRSGSLPGEPAIPPRKLLNWEITTERQPRHSPDGTRIAFVSNRLSVASPSPSSGNYIYILDNAKDVQQYGVSPLVQLVTPPREDLDDLGPVSYPSAEHPCWLADGSHFAFVGRTNVSMGDSGEIAIMRTPFKLSQGPVTTPTPFPSPTATGTPVPTATPVDTNNISLMNQYFFDTGGDGWTFGSVPSVHNEPAHSTLSGSLSLTSIDDQNEQVNNTFGFFDSPRNALQLFPFTEVRNPEDPFDHRQGPLYLYRAYVRRTSADALRAPTLRIRVNSSDFQSNFLAIMNSLGANPPMPDTTQPTAVDLLFEPPVAIYNLAPTQQTYSLSFDLVNFEALDDPTGGYVLDRVEVFRVPQSRVQTIATIRDYTLDVAEDHDDWELRGVPEVFDVPNIYHTAVSFAAQITNPNRSYGYAATYPDRLTVNPAAADGKLFVRMRSQASSSQPDGKKVPHMRFRVMQSDFVRIAEQGAVPVGQSILLPNAAQPRFFYTYLEVGEEKDDPFNIIAAWDVIAFGQNQPAPSDTAFLEQCKLDLVRINGYPAPDTGR